MIISASSYLIDLIIVAFLTQSSLLKWKKILVSGKECMIWQLFWTWVRDDEWFVPLERLFSEFSEQLFIPVGKHWIFSCWKTLDFQRHRSDSDVIAVIFDNKIRTVKHIFTTMTFSFVQITARLLLSEKSPKLVFKNCFCGIRNHSSLQTHLTPPLAAPLTTVTPNFGHCPSLSHCHCFFLSWVANTYLHHWTIRGLWAPD